MQQTQNWTEKDKQYLWHAMGGYNPDASPMVVTEADGAWITDNEGNRYLDGMAGQWAVNAGYGREELARVAYEQLKTMPYYPLVQSHKPAIELAEKLNEWLGDEYVIFFSNSGSEANDTAFKIARQYHRQNGEPGRYKFIARYRGYHGNTFGSGAATGQAERRYRYEPLAPGFLHVQAPDPYRCDYCDGAGCGPECARKYARQIDNVINWELNETVAGVIMEPVISGGGILVPPDGYVENVAEICRERGALLIIDEVICGFGRLGKPFGFQHHDIKPDIVTMAKGITSAYLPLSATAVRRELFEGFEVTEKYDRFRHINTFGGNPAACALAVRNLEIMEEEGLVERSAALGERLRDELAEIEDHPNVGEVRNKGLLFGIEMVEDKESRQPASADKVDGVVAACKERGLILIKNADTVRDYSNILALCPPLNITDEDLEFIARTLKEAFEQI